MRNLMTKQETVPCGCCREPMCIEDSYFALPCGGLVCETCYDEVFYGGEECPHQEPGTSQDCLDCILALVEAGPEYMTYSDADPGL